ncbi:hypothetical protein [Azospirillum argentinense]|nr:hypothetical protein [Azospirillum argentinense]
MADEGELDLLTKEAVEGNWIDVRVREALGVATVPEEVAKAVNAAMRGMQDRRLSSGEIARLTKEFLGILEARNP